MIVASYTTNATINGGDGLDFVGGLVGHSHGSASVRSASIIESYAEGGRADGGDGDNDVTGGLVGWNVGEVIASYATGDAIGGDGDNDVTGGLVGSNRAVITASYATEDAIGGDGDNDVTGGLVGSNIGSITASYATGDAIGGDGDNDVTGGLVGSNDSGAITASYATGTVNSGDGDNIGGLVGFNDRGAIAESYGFGTLTGTGTRNTHGAPPASVTAATALTATNAGARWNAAADDTMGAWDFGSATQTPALRFADYDGTGTDYDCADYSAMLPDGSTLTCGTTLIPGQGR